MTTEKVMKGFFYFAFICFLSASIPHVAYFFLSFESMSNGPVAMGIAYGLAISIDVTIFLCSISLTQVRNRGRVKVFQMYLFIIGLTAFSWYVNSLYSEHFHNTGMLAGSTEIALPYVGSVNPLIASCFPLLVIAYTWLSDIVGAQAHTKTVEELKKEAQALEDMNREKARIQEAHRGKLKRGILDLVDTAIEVRNHTRKALKSPQEAPTLQAPVVTPSIDTQAPTGPTDDVQAIVEPLSVLSLPEVQIAQEEVKPVTEEEAIKASIPSSNGHEKVVPLYTPRRKK